MNKKTLTNKIEGSIFFVCIEISSVNFFKVMFNIRLIFLKEFQKFNGSKITENILNQFSEKVPVAGSKTENKLVIIFKQLIVFYCLIFYC